jgi:hypothetical protein
MDQNFVTLNHIWETRNEIPETEGIGPTLQISSRRRPPLMISPEKKPSCSSLSLNISSPIPDYVAMQGHISKLLYTRKQRKEFLRTWTAIGRAHVSASHGPDLFQLLDIASRSLVADHDCDDCGPLYTAHPSPAGSTLCTPNSTAAISTLKPGATSTSLFSSSGLRGTSWARDSFVLESQHGTEG